MERVQKYYILDHALFGGYLLNMLSFFGMPVVAANNLPDDWFIFCFSLFLFTIIFFLIFFRRCIILWGKEDNRSTWQATFLVMGNWIYIWLYFLKNYFFRKEKYHQYYK